jgi:hypothetical protein
VADGADLLLVRWPQGLAATLSMLTGAQIVSAITTAQPVVAPTIDDGPHPATTPALLDVLAAAGARATFFVLGSLAARHPELIERIAREGHELGNHLMHDEPSVRLKPHGFGEQLAQVHALLTDATRPGRKRVTLVYRPHDPGTAAELVEADVRSAQFLATSRRQGSARDDLALRSARQSAAEEAAGAGVVRFSLLVTLTVDQPGQRRHAERVLEGLGATARLQLRRAWGAPAVTFAAGLPTGILLPEHVRVPTIVREGLQ